MIVHHRIGLKDVRPDLAAKGDVPLLLVHFRLLRVALGDRALVEPRLEHLHRGRLVLPLAALLLAGHDDVRRQVSNPHCRRRLVDVLAALAGRAEHIDAQVIVLDFDFDLVVDFRIDEHRRE